jgi:hypothetical protein
LFTVPIRDPFGLGKGLVEGYYLTRVEFGKGIRRWRHFGRREVPLWPPG